MTADFSGSSLPLPPGIESGPQVVGEFPAPVWWSPTLGESDHLLVGGRTVWVEQKPAPAAIVIAHPNRFGCGEDLAGLAGLASRYKAGGWVIVDPLLSGLVQLPPPLRAATTWPNADPEIVTRAGRRSLQAADGLQRRLAEVAGLSWPVVHPAGRTLTCVTPLPSLRVLQGLQLAGVEIGLGGWWEGLVTFTAGWWHTRDQLDGVATALAAVLAGETPQPVATDRFDRIPDDLPLRRLNRIMGNLRGG